MRKLTGCGFPLVQVVAVAAMALALCGCANMTKEKVDSYGKIAKSYYEAPNVAQLWVIENTNGGQVCEFKVSNFTRFEMNTPVPPKNIIPQNPSWMSSLGSAVKDIAPYFLLGWMFRDADLGGGSTVNNNAAATP